MLDGGLILFSNNVRSFFLREGISKEKRKVCIHRDTWVKIVENTSNVFFIYSSALYVYLCITTSDDLKLLDSHRGFVRSLDCTPVEYHNEQEGEGKSVGQREDRSTEKPKKKCVIP